MRNCPKCGQPVREGQRFCGVCGAEIPAASAPASDQGPVPTPVSPRSSPNEEPEAPYAYPPSSSENAYSDEEEEPRRRRRLILTAAVLLVALCCALALGIVIGLEASCYLPGNTCGTPLPTVLPKGTPSAVPTRTPTSLLPMLVNWLT